MNVIQKSVFVAGMCLLVTACGRKGPLLYPDMLVPAAPSAVSAQQSGASVKLRFTLSESDRSGRPVRDMAGVKISRRRSGGEQKEVCQLCMDDFIPFQTLYLDRLPAVAQRFGNLLVVLDTDVHAGSLYSYRIVPFRTDNSDGAASSPADVRVIAPLAAPALKIESHPTELRLQFSPYTPSAGRLLGYNLYRSSAVAGRSYLPLNRELLPGTGYVDGALERRVTYRYRATAVIMLASGDVVESTESEEVEGMLKDDE